jgi:hypothetical protein
MGFDVFLHGDHHGQNWMLSLENLRPRAPLAAGAAGIRHADGRH